MSIKNRVKDLAEAHQITVAELERTLGLGNGTIARWDHRSPSSEKLQMVAKYFNVSVDFLLGNDKRATDGPEAINDSLGTIMSFDGKPVTDHDRKVMKDLLESYLKNKQ